MDLSAVRKTWNSLAGRRLEFIDTFYTRLFERYPEYQKLFPPDSMGMQKEKMVEMLSSVARFADNIGLVRTYLLEVGAAHQRMGISSQDIRNFTEVFLDSLAATCGESWQSHQEVAWREVFDEVIIPTFEEGLSAQAGGTER